VVNLKAQIGKKFYIKISKRQELIMKEIQTQRINTYLDALRAYPPEWEALITEKERYTFGELIEAAERVRKHPKEIEEKQGTDDRASAYSVSGIWRRKYGSGDCTVRCKNFR
jgi:hypothetical protein